MSATAGKIHGAMVAIMKAVKPIGKDQKNVQQGYKFRGIADAYRALQQVMAANDVYSIPVKIEVLETREGKTRGGGSMWYLRCLFTYRFTHVDGSSVDVQALGEGMDTGDKCSGKAMSTADKYALLQAFKIPEDKPDDVENDSPEMVSSKPTKHDEKYRRLSVAIEACETVSQLKGEKLVEGIKAHKQSADLQQEWQARYSVVK